MKSIRCDLPKDLKQIKIEIFSDLHIGSKKCNYDVIHERIERVRNDPFTYCICLGDFLNNSTKTSVGDVYSEELTPMQEIQKAINLFEPIKNKILCITSGNHERRSYKTDGVDLMWMFAKELGLADKYDYCSCLAFIRLGNDTTRGKGKDNQRKVCYTLYMTHGDGNSGRTIGGKMNGLQRRGSIVNADIVVTGHTHQAASFWDSFFEVDYQNSSVRQKNQLFVNAGATLDYEEYAELYGMKPSVITSPVIVLNGTKKEMSVIS